MLSPTAARIQASWLARGFQFETLDHQADLRFQLGDPLLQLVNLLAFGIWQVAVLQQAPGFTARAHNAAGNADHRRAIRHRMHHYRAGADLDVVANADTA